MHRIVVIEDAEDNRDLLYYLLRDEFEVLPYASGEEALRALAQGQDTPDLIVLDIWLPGRDGIEILKEIRQDSRLRQTPVMALTANAMAGDREKCLAAGFDEYVSKPITGYPEFISTIRRMIAGRVD